MPFDAPLAFSGILGATGIAAAALGAHFLRARLPEEKSAAFRTGALYSTLGAITGFAFRAFRDVSKGEVAKQKRMDLAIALVSAGSALFSWSIYLLCLGGPRILGPVTPIGGILMICGWTTAATAAAL